MTKKKKRIILAVVFGICIMYFVGFVNEYRIINNNYILKRHINEELSSKYQEDYDSESLKIRHKVKIDNKLIVYYTFNEEGSGFLMLEQGQYLSYDLKEYTYADPTGWPENFKFNQVIYTNDGKYIVIMGDNPDAHTNIQFTFEDTEYQRTLPSNEYFILYVEVPQNSDPVSHARDIRLYD